MLHLHVFLQNDLVFRFKRHKENDSFFNDGTLKTLKQPCSFVFITSHLFFCVFKIDVLLNDRTQIYETYLILYENTIIKSLDFLERS